MVLCLQGLTLRVPAGSSCALVGTSGSGKSTVLRLLFRFYDAEAGAVRIGGQDVRDLKVREGWPLQVAHQACDDRCKHRTCPLSDLLITLC